MLTLKLRCSEAPKIVGAYSSFRDFGKCGDRGHNSRPHVHRNVRQLGAGRASEGIFQYVNACLPREQSIRFMRQWRFRQLVF